MADIALPPGTISIRPLETAAQTFAAHDVLSEVWGGDGSGMPPNLLRALAHSGNYTMGVYDGERMIGASAAFFAAPGERTMHSHITGILPEYRGRHIGQTVKMHQRQWALQRDVHTITWTFDPLVARNAHFNLRVLGARVVEYLPDFYGSMDDGVNRGDESDRLLVAWDLAAPARSAAPGVTSDAVVRTVAVPPDVEALRRTAHGDAAAWRTRVRDAFHDCAADGLRVAGFDDARGYLFVRA